MVEHNPHPEIAASAEAPPQDDAEGPDSGDLSDMLGETRVLLPSAQLLTAFLITVPFNPGFAQVVAAEKMVFLATFLFSVMSLILLSAPAVQHRLIRPLVNRERFKRLGSKQIVAGSVTLSLALTLGTQLVLSEVFGHRVGNYAAGLIGTLIVMLWWVFPKFMKAKWRV